MSAEASSFDAATANDSGPVAANTPDSVAANTPGSATPPATNPLGLAAFPGAGARKGRAYLSRLRITSFGAFTNTTVGPFSPQLNVVFGRNEAGKTTLASFVGGVLFGWEEARGGRNTYKPANAERSGSLVFAYADAPESRETAPHNSKALTSREAAIPHNREAAAPTLRETELSRTRNADGLEGDASLVTDIDKETFQTIFSLTSDELRSLRNTTDITARLLTAGSGTGSSPAQALADVQADLAEYTSKAAAAEHSLVRLGAQLDDLRAQLAEATDEAECFRQRDKEFHEIAPQRDELLGRLDSLNAAIEKLTAQRTALEKLEREISSLEEQIADLAADEQELESARPARPADVPRRLMRLTSSDDRTLRDQLDVLAAEEAKVEHAVDLAQDNCATSKAAYEALLEAGDVQAAEARARRQRRVQVWLSVLLPLMFMAAGVPIFMHGRSINSLSFTALGIGLVVFALFMACAALVMLFRPNKEAEALEARKQDAQWVMLQDRKKLEACREAQQRTAARIREQLDDEGLASAQGSLRCARALLDEARDARADEGMFQQRRQALVSRRTALEDSLNAALRQRRRLADDMGMRTAPTLSQVDELISQRSQQRSGLMETSEHLNRRYGELRQELSQAKRARRFDELKMRFQQTSTRREESALEYARLLLAKRMLEAAIAAWESTSQPEVYRQASRLLALMTGGKWVKVSMTGDGRLQIVDSEGAPREPVHLSMGTCQQLYLALRIALLMAADNVGRAVPVLADDILVHFDAERRAGAARALAELARSRQVILFTCHEEVVKAMRMADPTLNEVEL